MASGGTTRTTCAMPGTESKASSAQRQAGRPENSIQSLSPPIRRPLPPATSTAATCAATLRVARLVARLGEDHAARDGLQHPGHRHRHLLVHGTASALDHDHRSVVEVADPLAGLLSVLDDLDAHLFAWMNHRLHRIGQLV